MSVGRNRVPSGVLFLKGAVLYIGDPKRALMLKTTPMMMVSVGLGSRDTAGHCELRNSRSETWLR